MLITEHRRQRHEILVSLLLSIDILSQFIALWHRNQWTNSSIDIFGAVIGISGVILPFLSSPLVDRVYNKPEVHIDIGPLNIDWL